MTWSHVNPKPYIGHLNKVELNAWIQLHDSMYRLVCKDDRHLGTPRFPTVFEVCGAAGFPVPQSRLSAARIMHAERAVRMDNDPLLSLLALEDGVSSNSWLKVLRKDLMWQYWVPSVEATVSFECMTPDELVVWFSERRLRPLIRKALSEQIKSLAEWTQWQLDKRTKKCMKGVVGFQREFESVDGAVCPICGFEATSGSQLAGHLGSVHGHTNIAWSFIQSSSCRICLRQFWDVQRLFAHLNASNCCLALSFAILEPNQLQDDVVIGGDLDEDSRDFAHALLYERLDLCGPRP